MLTAEVYTKNALVNTVTSPRLLLKYRLKEYFIRFCGCENQIARAKQLLMDSYGIAPGTLNYDLNLRACDTSTIPAQRLNIYAAFFGIEVNSLES